MAETRIVGEPSNPPRRLGDGNVDIAVGVVKGRVHVELVPGHDWFAMDAENARTIAEAVARAAYEARYGVKPTTAESRLSTDRRVQMIGRARLVANSLAQQGKNDMEIATAVVDVILKEIA